MEITLKLLGNEVQDDLYARISAAWGQSELVKIELGDVPEDHEKLVEMIVEKLRGRKKIILQMNGNKPDFIDSELPTEVKEKLQEEVFVRLRSMGVRILTGPRLVGGF